MTEGSKSEYPGYEARKHIREVLPQLSRQMRTAFGAACAERVLPILDAYFTKRGELFRRAIDLSWRWATGETVDEKQIQETIDACEKLVDKLYDNDEGASVMRYALDAVSFTLQSTMKPESKVVEEAVSHAHAAAQTEDGEHGDEHIQEEVDWQMLALEVARNATQPTRGMFQHLSSNPQWLQLFRAKTRS